MGPSTDSITNISSCHMYVLVGRVLNNWEVLLSLVVLSYEVARTHSRQGKSVAPGPSRQT